jgi:hypothetical protein
MSSEEEGEGDEAETYDDGQVRRAARVHGLQCTRRALEIVKQPEMHRRGELLCISVAIHGQQAFNQMACQGSRWLCAAIPPARPCMQV